MIVTAPTCGASGVLPALLYYLYKHKGIKEEKIIESIGIAGIIGNVIKHNATISGAVGGCQAEVGFRLFDGRRSNGLYRGFIFR